MKQTSTQEVLRVESERRIRAKTIDFIAGMVLQVAHIPDHEKGLVPVIGTATTRNNHEAVVDWIENTWAGQLGSPREVAHVLTAHLVAILVDMGR
jgi:hypothetical protein